MIGKLFLLAAFGALGTLLRYGSSAAVDRLFPDAIHWGTLAVNLAGCLLFGIVFAATESRLDWQGDFRVIALTGFMGAFTTYSTFAYQSTTMLRDGHLWTAAGNIIAHNLLGILCVVAGLATGKIIT